MRHWLSVFVMLCVVCMPHCLANLIFQCRDFDPQNSGQCGLNTAQHHWTIHDVKSLPKILYNSADLRYVLYMDNGDNGMADYQLSGPSPTRLSTVQRLCVQFAFLASDSCVTEDQSGAVCTANVTVRVADTGLVVRPERQFDFPDQGWQIFNAQFSLSSSANNNGGNFQILLHGFILGNSRSQSSPYMGIKFINVFNGTCTERIGLRKGFWITVIVLFCLLTGYTFVHIAVVHSLREHRKRRGTEFLNT